MARCPLCLRKIRAVSYLKGEVVAETSVQTSGEPAGLRLVADRTDISADGMDLYYVSIEDMVDALGRRGPWTASLRSEG